MTPATQIEAEALSRSVVSEFENYVKLNKKISPEVVAAVTQIDDYAQARRHRSPRTSRSRSPTSRRFWRSLDVAERLEKVSALMESEISVLQVEKRIRTRVKRQMEKTQREYYLNEQMKAIQKELGDEDGKDELAELEERIKKTKLSKEAREKAHGRAEEAPPDVARCRRKRRSCATISTGCCRSRGASGRRSRRTSSSRRRSSTTTTTAWRRSRSASSSTSPCSSAPTS